MIICNVLGGLGNQMFQYAAARALAATTGQPLLLDVNDFDDYRLHQGYDLRRVFDVNTPLADSAVIRDMLGWRAQRLARRLLRRRWAHWLRGSRLIVEPHFHHWPGFAKLTQDCYLLGYWQSERYFDAVSDEIRSAYGFKEPLTARNQALAAEMLACHAVSLHVRRGDYVSDRKTSKVMAVCTQAYYQSAIEHIAASTQQPVFYVFSDDFAWAKQHLPTKYRLVYVEHNTGIDSYRDMQMMSLCRHHIIANSSFSWWGAWLNPRPDKLVVAPSGWFLGNQNTRDLIPTAWTRL
jgi:hypothetical protein